jgi:hypothetical protein
LLILTLPNLNPEFVPLKLITFDLKLYEYKKKMNLIEIQLGRMFFEIVFLVLSTDSNAAFIPPTSRT